MRRIVFAIAILFALALSLSLFECAILLSSQEVLVKYPDYLAFMPKIPFKNQYFDINITTWIINFTVNHKNIVAYYGFLSCEENYEGNWELEHFEAQKILADNATHKIFETASSLLTYNITKTWTFFYNKNYFYATITKTYLFNSTTNNNQIILDITNQKVETQGNDTALFYLGNFTILEMNIISSNKPVTIQPPAPHSTYPSELQLNFENASDADYRFHYQGEVETVTLKFTMNPFAKSLYTFVNYNSKLWK